MVFERHLAIGFGDLFVISIVRLVVHLERAIKITFESFLLDLFLGPLLSLGLGSIVVTIIITLLLIIRVGLASFFFVFIS